MSELDFSDLIVVAVSELDFSDVIFLMVHLTTGRLAALKWLEIGFDWFVEIGVQVSEIVSTIGGSFHFLLTSALFSTEWKLDVLPDCKLEFEFLSTPCKLEDFSIPLMLKPMCLIINQINTTSLKISLSNEQNPKVCHRFILVASWFFVAKFCKFPP